MKIADLFKIERGRGEYYSKMSPGSTPLISATTLNNGVIGRIDIEPTFTAPCITVERVSGRAFVQYEDFATVPDDLSVLVPLQAMSFQKLMYAAALINSSRWKYSYGRKLTGTRLKKLLTILEMSSEVNFDANIDKYTLSPPDSIRPPSPNRFEEHLVIEYFDLMHGDFHSLDALEEGCVPTVSRVTYHNGIVGRYKPPENAIIYPPLTLTVSTVSGDAFLQIDEFMATDNVVVLVPKGGLNYSLFYLLYVQSMINRTKWKL